MGTRLNADDVRRIRMGSLLIGPRPPRMGAPSTVSEVVTHFGAMQAQDNASGLWSLGLRLPGSSVADVTAALEEPQALRTWPMRGTVHLVPARDAHWMLACTGARALKGAAKRRETLGLSDGMAERAIELIGEKLAGGRRLTRSALLDELRQAGLPIEGQMGYHVLWYASQRGVSAIAPDVDGEQTFVLLDEWVPDPLQLEGDAALTTLARRYFRSHGPTTVKDFAGWTGLTLTECRRGIAAAGDSLSVASYDGIEVYADTALMDLAAAIHQDDEVHALPGFDEYMLGYKDRSLMLDPNQLAQVVPGGNGVFRPTFVRNGRVIGTWTRTTRGKKGVVTAVPLVRLGAKDRTRLERSLEPWAEFTGVALEVRWADQG